MNDLAGGVIPVKPDLIVTLPITVISRDTLGLAVALCDAGIAKPKNAAGIARVALSLAMFTDGGKQ